MDIYVIVKVKIMVLVFMKEILIVILKDELKLKVVVNKEIIKL